MRDESNIYFEFHFMKVELRDIFKHLQLCFLRLLIGSIPVADLEPSAFELLIHTSL